MLLEVKLYIRGSEAMIFLHTVDRQLGMKAVHISEVGERIREERLLAARRVVGDIEVLEK